MLQCVAVCCSVLQCVAVYYKVIGKSSWVRLLGMSFVCCSVLQNVLQGVAGCCCSGQTILGDRQEQLVAALRNVICVCIYIYICINMCKHMYIYTNIYIYIHVYIYISVLQCVVECVSVCCSVLQCDAV